MASRAENGSVGQAERPRIETIGAAAGEITRLFGLFDTAAVAVTPEYLAAQLAGEEGKTWGTFRGLPNRRIPFLAPITRRGGIIELGAGFTFGGPIRANYRLQQGPLLVPGEEGQFTRIDDAVTLREPGLGFYPGQEYVAFGDRLLEAGYRSHGLSPTAPRDWLEWSNSKVRIDDTHQEMEAVTPDLLSLIAKIQAYEPVQ